jgi:metal-responsive CopG/Arc/MetJ family transcriptional regulator
MPRTEDVYTERLTVKITRHMLADLTNVATKGGNSVSAVVRQAIRNYLDGTDLTLGTRRTFDRRFEKRMIEMEQNLKQILQQGLGQIEQNLRQGMGQDWRQVERLMQRSIDQTLTRLTLQVSQVIREQEEQKGKRRR